MSRCTRKRVNRHELTGPFQGMGQCINGQTRTSLMNSLYKFALAELPFRIGANGLRALRDPSRSNGSSGTTKDPSAAAIAATTVEFIVHSPLSDHAPALT